MKQAFVFVVFLTAFGGDALVASAQDAPSAEQRRAAAEAYDRGSAAYLAEHWAQAAEWFETAHRLAPAAPALIQAVRSYDLANEMLRAGTLALRLAQLYGDDDSARETADPVLERAWPRFVRVDVRCDGCTVELDGTLLEHPSFFVQPGPEHAIAGHFATGDVTETVEGQAGERRELTLTAPPSSDDHGGGALGNGQGGSGAGARRERPGEGLPPLVFITAAVLTAGSGALLLWSGLDTLAGVDAYEADPTTARLAEGQDKELRTNVFIGVTAGLGLVSLALAFFTDWSGGGEEASVALMPLPGGGLATIGGRL